MIHELNTDKETVVSGQYYICPIYCPFPSCPGGKPVKSKHTCCLVCPGQHDHREYIWVCDILHIIVYMHTCSYMKTSYIYSYRKFDCIRLCFAACMLLTRKVYRLLNSIKQHWSSQFLINCYVFPLCYCAAWLIQQSTETDKGSYNNTWLYQVTACMCASI